MGHSPVGGLRVGRRASIASAWIAMVALVSLGCSAGPAASIHGTSPPATTTPSQAPSSSPAPSAASETSRPTSAPTPASTPDAAYPGVPPLEPGIVGTLEIDSFATAAVDIVPASEVPGGPPWRFDTGDPDPSTHPVIGFGRGLPLVVLYGPVVVDGVEWYLLTSAVLAVDVPVGWSPMTAPDSSDWVVPTTLACPPSPMTVEQLAPLGLTDGLAACYGDAEITIESGLVCNLQPDRWATGPTWMEGGVCEFEADPAVDAMHASVYGLGGDLPSGRYRVTGHFDDPQSRICREPGDDTDASRLVAVLHCRKGFVATSVDPAG